VSLRDSTCVRSIRCDVSEFNFTMIAPTAFCLLDVDLYLPIHEALPRLA
jgi:hypothetical protein